MPTSPSPSANASGAPSTVALRRGLLAFFDTHARDLPWRRTGDPYAIWVSEIMLQQTRVETVVPYFRRWMERFPDIATLAGADEDEVLQAWEGLGYYRRARWLHRGARTVRERHGGELPRDPDELRGIPGIGAYTAGAVASIAFGVPAPAVDGNVRRVLSRLFDLPDPGDDELRILARELVDRKRPGDFNQALMELGATVCTPRAPACDACPVKGDCLAYGRGVQRERPRPQARRAVPALDAAVAVVVREAAAREGRGLGGEATHELGARILEVALVQRPVGGLLAGLWELPGSALPGNPTDHDVVEAARRAVTLPGDVPLPARGARVLDPVRHAYSHLRVTYRPVLFTLPAGDGGDAAAARPGATDVAIDARGARGTHAGSLATPIAYPTDTTAPPARAPDWVDAAELRRRALPRAQRRIVEQVADLLAGSLRCG